VVAGGVPFQGRPPAPVIEGGGRASGFLR
jgi:hypothetical protein